VTTHPAQELVETPDPHGSYPRLSDEQIEELAVRGERRATQAGDILFREGQLECDFFVIAAGKVAVVEGFGGDEQLIGLHGRGRFLGEASLLTGEASFVTAVVREAGEVIAVPVDQLRQRVAEDPELGDLILRAFLLRRWMLIGQGTGLRIVGSRYSPDTRRLREFAARNRLPHRFVDLEEDESAEALLRQLSVRPEETPIVIWRGNKVLRNPSNAELARVIGLPVPRARQEVSDLIVIGAGPAGLAAAVYGASEGLSTMTLDAVATGGQAATSPRIENYLGFPAGISGAEFAERATIQAGKFGAHLAVPAQAAALEQDDGHHRIRLDDGTFVGARTVILATGARYRRLALRGLERFEGVSIFYSATIVEAQICRGDPVAVVGGGNSAAQASLFLADHTPEVWLLIRDDRIDKDMSRYLADRILRHPRIDVRLNTEVRKLRGEDALHALVVENNETGERTELPARALFVFIGAEPSTAWLDDALELDDDGFVLTGQAVRDGQGEGDGRAVRLLETSRAGVFAAGDVRSGSVKRVASAAGEGAMAIRLVHDYLGELESWRQPGQT
jgi:thioredoxin reductase (NADPH)